MDSMQCYTCVQKHLANALSYGKEILSGHTQGADLDHRIDFLGELGNAEHHLELIDRELFLTISQFRKEIQEKNNKPDYIDLETIRKLFLAVEKLSAGDKTTSEVKTPAVSIQETDIVFPSITNLEYFKLALESIQKHGRGWNRIFCLNSSVDLKDFEIEKISSFDDPALGERFLYWQETMCLLRDVDLRAANPVYGFSPEKRNHLELVPLIRKHNPNQPIYLYDGIAPQPVEKKQFLELTSGVKTDYPMTLYFNSIRGINAANSASIAVHVDKKICCSVKSRLQTCVFATWNDEGFGHLKEYLNARS